MAKQKEFDLTLTLRSPDAIKTKKFQKLIDEIVQSGPDGIGVDDEGFVLVGVNASEVRKVDESGNDDSLLKAAEELGIQLDDFSGTPAADLSFNTVAGPAPTTPGASVTKTQTKDSYESDYFTDEPAD